MRGPVNPSLNYECGLLLEGFDSPPTFQMTYNADYYSQLIERHGFAKVQDLYAFWGHVDMLATLDKKLEFIVAEATRRFRLECDTWINRVFVKKCGRSWIFTTLRSPARGASHPFRKVKSNTSVTVCAI